MSTRTTRTLALAGDEVATLLRHPAEGEGRGAVLYVHGFSDYFFQDHVAEHFAARGLDFYALDLRRYGRSLRAGEVPAYVDDLTQYFEELDAALRAIREDGNDRVVVMAHSTGGLITPLWLHAQRGDPAVRDVVGGLVLNSPWFELAEPWLLRTVGTWLLEVVGAVRPHLNLRSLGTTYGHSLHRDHHGEWDFDLAMKPLSGFPVLAGWLRAIRRGHRRLHRGLRVPVPVLVLRSSRSALRAPEWSPAVMRADAVLDVDHMSRFAPRLGRDVTVVEVDDGMHDLFLSAEPVRRRAFEAVDAWLAERVDWTPRAAAGPGRAT